MKDSFTIPFPRISRAPVMGRAIKSGALLGVLAAAFVFTSCLPPHGFWFIDNTETIKVVDSGPGMVWKGSLADAPPEPKSGWAYLNTGSNEAYVYDGTAWTILTENSVSSSFIWKGSKADHAALTGTPETGWAYYNEADGAAYIYTGQTGTGQYTAPYVGWDLLAETGAEYFLMNFDSRGGSVVPSFLARTGSLVAAPSAPVWEGYVFDRWLAGDDSPYDWNTPVTGQVTLYAEWMEVEDWLFNLEDFGEENTPHVFNIYDVAGWKDAIDKISDPDTGSSYYSQYYVLNIRNGIGLGASASGNNPALSASRAEPATVSIRGKTVGGIISLNENGNLLAVSASSPNYHIILRNITLRGHGGNNAPVISLSGSAGGWPRFTMKNGSVITGNWNNSGAGGAVAVQGNAVFTMEGNASIYANDAGKNSSANGQGGGVYVAGGSFIMRGNASVASNRAFFYSGSGGGTDQAACGGGGVYIGENGTFKMEGSAAVYDNSATGGYGGGIYAGGTFTMAENAIIHGNTAGTGQGGGVYTPLFTNTSVQLIGGVIYGTGTYAAARANVADAGAVSFYAEGGSPSPKAQYGTVTELGVFQDTGNIPSGDNTVSVWNGYLYLDNAIQSQP
ncbi:MAG: InlB B-repeat-containing protein [Spirochaetaceae bacterium]|nr:InlB B-repeat-containing protein [Spirochaetaceae bacterium]